MSLMQAFGKLLRLSAYEQHLSAKNVVLITGCDSGLGYTLAIFCHSLNMTVIAGCHNSNSEGARHLQQMSKHAERMHILEVELRDAASVTKAHAQIEKILSQDSNDKNAYEFTALVNNAGSMCFGEFEWQTPEQYAQQIDVNVLGTWRITKEMLPLVRRHRARIINITSHCALMSLPGTAAYAASKAALRGWNDALRIEMAQYGVKVINFVPGSFVMSSNIAARQQSHADSQLAHFTEEQKDFYGSYFQAFHNYLSIISGIKAVKPLEDAQLLKKFQHALTNTQPYEIYIHEPLRYKLYRLLHLFTPTSISDWLMVKFCAMPTYAQVTHEKNNKIQVN